MNSPSRARNSRVRSSSVLHASERLGLQNQPERSGAGCGTISAALAEDIRELPPSSRTLPCPQERRLALGALGSPVRTSPCRNSPCRTCGADAARDAVFILYPPACPVPHSGRACRFFLSNAFSVGGGGIARRMFWPNVGTFTLLACSAAIRARSCCICLRAASACLASSLCCSSACSRTDCSLAAFWAARLARSRAFFSFSRAVRISFSRLAVCAWIRCLTGDI
mmetsp:Transcript_39542/g.79032  ORF Transcript_39542/g.79032 Transcript_39542/m.79032 type:complete len:225 (+) Transcript_39542:292-966(+)